MKKTCAQNNVKKKIKSKIQKNKKKIRQRKIMFTKKFLQTKNQKKFIKKWNENKMFTIFFLNSVWKNLQKKFNKKKSNSFAIKKLSKQKLSAKKLEKYFGEKKSKKTIHHKKTFKNLK